MEHDTASARTRLSQYGCAGPLLLLGLSLSLRGYQCLEGDQAYRLPLLLHRQQPLLYDTDPFVRAFDQFNPHAGYLAVLDASSRLLGLCPALFVLYAITVLLAVNGVGRLARSAWPGRGEAVALVGPGLFLVALAGNIGTNHLHGPMLLDRLMVLAAGWWALARVVDHPARGLWLGPLVLAVASGIHPSLGLQLAGLFGAGWVAWGSLGPRRCGVTRPMAATALVALVASQIPVLLWSLRQSRDLLAGLDADTFRIWATQVQGPQHMLPELWRLPQWLAWGCYPLLALLALMGSRDDPATLCSEGDGEIRARRTRLLVLVALSFVAVAAAWVTLQYTQDLRLVLFQPFRMATVARGLALVVLSGHVAWLWKGGTLLERLRCGWLVVGLTNDWSLVVVTAVELAAAGAALGGPRRWLAVLPVAVLAAGNVFLFRHDTAQGQWALLGATVLVGIWTVLRGDRPWRWYPARVGRALACAWVVPILALVATLAPEPPRGGVLAAGRDRLLEHCRFGEAASDDLERLALWVRGHTPPGARFIGPPGPKTFRLWSRRTLTFNRAASPYHAAGLADWAARFQDHVAFEGSPTAFAQAYLSDRQALERRYDHHDATDLARLADRQGADHVLAASSLGPRASESPLLRLRREGPYAVYRVEPISRRRAVGAASVGGSRQDPP